MTTKNVSGEGTTTTTGPNESRDAATLQSMVAESDEELGRKFDPKGRSRGAWQSTARLLRAVSAVHYVKEDPTDEAVASQVISKSLSFKSRSTEADKPEDGVADLSLVVDETGKEDDDEEPLKPLALKFRLAASLLHRLVPFVFKPDSKMDTTIYDFVDLRVKANKTPVDGIYSTDVEIEKECEVWARIFAFSDDGKSTDVKLPVVVYFHGGGFATLHPDSSVYDQLCRKIAKALNAVVISVNYRLTPDFRYPTQYDAGFKALQWLQRTPAGSDSLPANVDVSKTLLAGDSAGGNLAHHMGCRAAAADLGPVKIRGLILLQPFFGGVSRTKSELTMPNPVLLTNFLADWFWQAFLPHGADRDHEVANVTGPNAPDLMGLPLPPIFLVIGTHDILKDRQVMYGQMMARVIGVENVEVKKYYFGFHGFFALDKLLQKALVKDMQSFTHRVLAQKDSSTVNRTPSENSSYPK